MSGKVLPCITQSFLQVTESAKQNPLQVVAESTEQVQAVIAFAARYYSGGPFQDPVKVLLKVNSAGCTLAIAHSQLHATGNLAFSLGIYDLKHIRTTQ